MVTVVEDILSIIKIFVQRIMIADKTFPIARLGWWKTQLYRQEPRPWQAYGIGWLVPLMYEVLTSTHSKFWESSERRGLWLIENETFKIGWLFELGVICQVLYLQQLMGGTSTMSTPSIRSKVITADFFLWHKLKCHAFRNSRTAWSETFKRWGEVMRAQTATGCETS